MWTLSGRNTPELIDVLNRRYDIHSESINDCIDFLTAKSIESLPIDESVQNAISEMSLSKKQQETYKESLSSIVRFVVTQRCDLAGQMNMSAETDVDLRAIDMMRNARDMILFSRVVQKAAKSVLSEIEKKLSPLTAKTKLLTMPKPQSKKAHRIGLTIYSKTL